MRLILIRHGQTCSNVRGELDTAHPGAPLTRLGVRQAAAVVDAVSGEGVTGVYASPRVRTQQTASPLAGVLGLPIAQHEGLAEIAAGDLEMRSDADARHAYVDTLAGWLHGDLGRPMPGGHDGHEFFARYDAAIQAIAASHAADDTVAVFSHGAAIRLYTSRRTGLALDEAAALSIMNTGAAILEGDPDAGWRLLHWSTDPLGGAHLLDAAAHDVTGESVEEEQAE